MKLSNKLIIYYRELRRYYRIYKYERMNPNKYPVELCKIYHDMTGKTLNLNNPQRYSEKIQWMKVYGMKPIYSELADKYAVREWVKERIGLEYVIPCYGVWQNYEDIDFLALPSKFVIKTTNGCGTNIIVTDKETFNEKAAKRKLKRWLKLKYEFSNGFEMQYASIKPRIIIEQFIEDPKGLPDYKFLCFNGKVFCLYLMENRANSFDDIVMGILDRNFKLMPYARTGHTKMKEAPPKPKNYDKMVEIAETLSEGFQHVRVDLYNVDGKIYFGEMTFTGGGGYGMYDPDEFDYILGNMWKLNV